MAATDVSVLVAWACVLASRPLVCAAGVSMAAEVATGVAGAEDVDATAGAAAGGAATAEIPSGMMLSLCYGVAGKRKGRHVATLVYAKLMLVYAGLVSVDAVPAVPGR